MSRYRSALIIGSSGSGKTTQGNELQRQGISYHLSMGQLTRELGEEHPLVKDYRKCNQQGDFGSSISIRLEIFSKGVDRAISEGLYDPSKHLLSIDGLVKYPNYIAAVDEILDIGCVFELYISHAQMKSRVNGRAASGERPESAKNRVLYNKLKIYSTHTKAVLAQYRGRGLLEVVNGARPVDIVNTDIRRALKNRNL